MTTGLVDTGLGCQHCGRRIYRESDSVGTGYGERDDGAGRMRVCYACCGELDRADMIERGRAVLYLTYEPRRPGEVTSWRTWEVANWPGTLRFRVTAATHGRHNLAGGRWDVWFDGPDGFVWHGVTIGQNTQVCHCRRTKRKAKGASNASGQPAGPATGAGR
jgi:hypothetical protein